MCTPTISLSVSFLGNDFAFAQALYFCVLFKYVQFLFGKEARRDFLVEANLWAVPLKRTKLQTGFHWNFCSKIK